MQTSFTEAQLADPAVAESNGILRACVHCGFCTATCPTYVLLGDELDSPRGRIYLIKDMLENDRSASDKLVTHIDRCLSCLACMTTCPSGVNYMHLVDHARMRIEETYRRPLFDRLVRWLLAVTLPHPRRFRAMLGLARLGRLVAPVLPRRLRSMLDLAPASPAQKPLRAGRVVHPPVGKPRYRVALLPGCVQQVLAARINEATVRLLTRHGCEVTIADGARCCGALTHHLGKEEMALASVRANVRAWSREIDDGGLDAIVVNASGCGTMVKDYGFLLRNDAELAGAAARISELARDVSEFADEIGVAQEGGSGSLAVTYQSACSLQHGQKITSQPKALLARAGFAVREPAEAHLCCGSAGTYNILQPDLAARLRDRKAANIARTSPQAVATGNIGCMMQLRDTVDAPVVHTVELLDWATGGPAPEGLAPHGREEAS